MKRTLKGFKPNLQLFALTYTPDNITMQDAMSGSIPSEYGSKIIEEVIQNSKMMQLARYEPMTKQSKKFSYLTGGLGAYWVGEGERIQTTKPTWVQAELVAKKVGTILVVSREYLNYTQAEFFEAMKGKIAEAFYKKFDEATILNVDNPFTNSVEEAAVTASNTVSGSIDYANVLGLEALIEDNDLEVNAFISKSQNNAALRNAVDTHGNALYDKNAKTLDGQPVVNLSSASMLKGTMYAGNFDYAVFGIPHNITYKISEDAQLSTIVASDSKPVNLFEQELIAVRATMDIAFMILKDEAFAKIALPVGP